MKDTSDRDMKKLKKIYYKSGIWLKWNWYDFLKEVLRICGQRPLK